VRSFAKAGSARARSSGLRAGVASALALSAANGFSAVYTENQNTYLLRAVADVEGGTLARDWLVRTADPTPAFSALLTPVIDVFGDVGIYALLVAAAFVFFAALLVVAAPEVLRDGGDSRVTTTVLVVAVALGILTLEPLILDGFSRLGIELWSPTLLRGVANQFALGHYLQPSVGGVFLVAGAAIALVAERPGAGVAVVSLAMLLHPGSTAAAVIVVGGIIFARAVLTRSPVATLRLAGVALGFGAIAVVANWDAFSALSGAAGERAADILARRRIRHHALPSAWLDGFTFIKLLVTTGIGIVLIRSGERVKRSLGLFLLSTLAVVVVSTTAVAILDDAPLMLTFPWRASVAVWPIAVAAGLGLVASGVTRSMREGGSRSAAVALGSLLLAVAATGVGVTAYRLSRDEPPDGLVAVAARVAPSGVGVIPPDMKNVRLGAGVRIYADWKSHPFAAEDVVTWYERVRRVRALYRQPQEVCAAIDRLDERVTWIVIPPSVASSRPACLARWTPFATSEGCMLVAPAEGERGPRIHPIGACAESERAARA
jgi:hypothetical protein